MCVWYVYMYSCILIYCINTLQVPFTFNDYGFELNLVEQKVKVLDIVEQKLKVVSVTDKGRAQVSTLSTQT